MYVLLDYESMQEFQLSDEKKKPTFSIHNKQLYKMEVEDLLSTFINPGYLGVLILLIIYLIWNNWIT